MAKRHRRLLSPTEVEKAKPKAKAYRLADGGALYLWVPPSGVKTWQFRYRHGGKPQTATFGKVSNTQGLAWARAKAEEARSRVEEGDHLTRVKAVKKATKYASSGNTFADVAASWVKSEAKNGMDARLQGRGCGEPHQSPICAGCATNSRDHRRDCFAALAQD